MATSVATGILIYLSHVFYLVELPFVVLPGTIVVFLASWLYTKESIARDGAKDSRSNQSNGCKAQNGKASARSTVSLKFNNPHIWIKLTNSTNLEPPEIILHLSL
jgi:hypothetical protein